MDSQNNKKNHLWFQILLENYGTFESFTYFCSKEFGGIRWNACSVGRVSQSKFDMPEVSVKSPRFVWKLIVVHRYIITAFLN